MALQDTTEWLTDEHAVVRQLRSERDVLGVEVTDARGGGCM